MKRSSVGGAALAAVLVLTGCAGQDKDNELTSASQTGGTEAPSRPEKSTVPTPEYVDEDTLEPRPRVEVPTWDKASRVSVVTAAEKAMRTFARPDLDQKTWWAGVQPLLTQRASRDYAYVEPSVIPASKVTGKGALELTDSAYVASVKVPTDAGVYTVMLNRDSGDAPWRVIRFTPPEKSD